MNLEFLKSAGEYLYEGAETATGEGGISTLALRWLYKKTAMVSSSFMQADELEPHQVGLGVFFCLAVFSALLVRLMTQELQAFERHMSEVGELAPAQQAKLAPQSLTPNSRSVSSGR